MLWHEVSLLLLVLSQANTLPLATQLSEEDEKVQKSLVVGLDVTKCITEILADTLSKPSPIPVTSECIKILREDERVLAMLHHQHLLAELEELAHQENAKHHLGHEGSPDAWGGEDEEQEELKKREKPPALQKEDASEKTWEQDGEQREEEQERKEYEKTEKTEEKVKEEKVSHEEGNQEAEEEQAKEEMEVEEENEGEVRRKKKRSSSETWSSKEYFGHTKKRGHGGPKIREVMLRGSPEGRKRNGLVKRHFRLAEEEEDDSSEEEPRKYHHGGYHGGRHHEDWEDEEEEEERKRSELAKRVAEKASDEETAQFEEEEKGVKISNSQSHLHGSWKPWQEKEEEEEEEEGKMRHRRLHHPPASLDLKKRHQKDDGYLKDRHHSHEEGDRETTRNEVQELEKLEEIERELKRAAEKLQELKRG